MGNWKRNGSKAQVGRASMAEVTSQRVFDCQLGVIPREEIVVHESWVHHVHTERDCSSRATCPFRTVAGEPFR